MFFPILVSGSVDSILTDSEIDSIAAMLVLKGNVVVWPESVFGLAQSETLLGAWAFHYVCVCQRVGRGVGIGAK